MYTQAQASAFPSTSHVLRHVAGLIWERARVDGDVSDITDEIALLAICYDLPDWRLDQLVRLFVGLDHHPLTIPMLDFVAMCLDAATLESELTA